MIACEKKLKVILPYKIVVVRTYILNFLTQWPPKYLCFKLTYESLMPHYLVGIEVFISDLDYQQYDGR